ncbi:hypothetical protein F5X98DRAFT_380342 [Xylaria grammica]|nr:hypothetical protein F5X98DRAFT_380342 [Xylaria grammica]
MEDYHFGVEIEVIAEPRKTGNPLSQNRALYYKELAAALRKRGLNAQADKLTEPYAEHPDHYDKWFITKDGSLAKHERFMPLEAISPVLNCEKS